MEEKQNPYPPDKYIVALTGGIATGKSFVAEILRDLGAEIVDTDVLSRRVVEPGSPVLEKIRETWGEKVFLPDGNLDRKAMAEVIFNSSVERQKLNDIMHPEIRKLMLHDVKESKKMIVVQVIPLLFEAKIPLFYDESWLAYCPRERQRNLLMKRDSLSLEATLKRIEAQIPIDEKVKMVNVVIDNSRDKETTRTQVEAEWRRLMERAEKTVNERTVLS